MSHNTPARQSTIRAALAGLLVFCVVMAVVVVWVPVRAAPQPSVPYQEVTPVPAETDAAASPTAPPKACRECHPDVDAAWSASPHAQAYSDPEFQVKHRAAHQPGDCLLCHTTGYDNATGEFLAEGVTCNACHGEAVADHPPAVVPVRSDSEYCGACHTPTHGEWRLSSHSAAGVGCMGCHNPHSQGALFADPNEMCLNCHKEDLDTHGNDTHIAMGIGCVDCHMLRLPPAVAPEDGLVPTGHTFTITPATCVACHTDTLGTGEALPGYEAGAKTMASQGTAVAGEIITPTLITLVGEYTGNGADAPAPQQQIQALEAALASSRLSTLFQGGIIGLVLGGTTAFFVARNARREEVIETAHTPEAAENEE